MIRFLWIYLIVSCLAILKSNAQSAFPFETVDSSTLRESVLIDCEPLLDSVPLTKGDYIVLLENGSITSAVLYHSDSATRVGSTGKDSGTANNYSYAVYRPSKDSCLYPVAVEYDTARLTDVEAELRVVSFEAASMDFRYPEEKYCTNVEIVQPYVTEAYRSRLHLSYNEGIEIDNQRNLYPSQSVPGNYTIQVNSDYCLVNKVLSIEIIKPEAAAGNEEINICPGKTLEDYSIRLNDYNIIDSSNIVDSNDNFTGIAYEIAKTDLKGCNVSRYLKINYINTTEPIKLEKIYHCDRTVLQAQKLYSWTDEFLNSPHKTDEGFEFYNDTIIQLSMIDSNLCISKQNYNIDIRKLALENVEYQLEESTCWEYGKIRINNLSLANNDGENLKYSLTNKVNGQTIRDFTDEAKLTEGIYRFSVYTDLGCAAEFNQDIVLMQECLEDFPVFAPSSLGVGHTTQGRDQSSYFIPYEGNVSIYNRNGVLLRKVETPAYWDGTDEGNNPLPMGNYVMVTNQGKVVNITIVR